MVYTLLFCSPVKERHEALSIAKSRMAAGENLQVRNQLDKSVPMSYYMKMKLDFKFKRACNSERKIALISRETDMKHGIRKKSGKRRLVFLAAFLLLWMTACGSAEKYKNLDENKITIIATLFPQYDFARQIAGDYANVVLLLPPGVESHSFDPSPTDMIAIQNADIFLYTGPYMESWAAEVIEGIGDSTFVVDLSAHVPLTKQEDIEAEYEADHEHGDEADIYGENHEHEDGTDIHEESHVHAHTYDPHIWTNPVYAGIMVEDIATALMECDPEHAEEYERNKDGYLAELDRLDKEIRTVAEGAEHKKLYFGGRFAMYYFIKEYGLTYEAVYDSCSSETEPSVKSVMHVITEMEENEIPVIYYEELVDPRIARTIAEETGAGMLLWHSCHSVTKKELEDGVTYLGLMWQNLENLKAGLYPVQSD